MRNILIIWNDGSHRGTICANDAVFEPKDKFCCESLELHFKKAVTDIGGVPTIVNVVCDKNPFSFLLRDVRADYPLYVPEYNVVVTEAYDARSYGQIVSDIEARGGKTKLQLIEEQEEYSFNKASAVTRNMSAPVWLGVSKDMRIFEVGLRTRSCGDETQQFDYVQPMRFSEIATPPELRKNKPKYSFITGRGVGCLHEITKRLEDGFLPILNSSNYDEGIVYDTQFFSAPEYSPYDSEHLAGTDMYVADMHGKGYMFTEVQKKHAEGIISSELNPDEEIVMFIRITAKNTTKAPALSYIKLPDPIPWREHLWAVSDIADMKYDSSTGFSYYPESGRVCCISSIKGKPVPQEEMAVILKPGEEIVYEIKIPHQPVPPERAEVLFEADYDKKLQEAKAFWYRELSAAAKINLPEKRIEEMIKAGLLHIDIAYFGKNPDKPVVPAVGVYTAIGSESAPGIQFLDSVGMHDLARRALQYFIEKQHEDGFIQNFGGYMLETGSVLWSLGEHFRFTRDVDWLYSIKDNILKACSYLIKWRRKNMTDKYKDGKGYGMIDGKTSDPEDPYHSFMLNSGAYIGLLRAAEMLDACKDENAGYIGKVAEELKRDIRETLRYNIEMSQLIPMGDGTWTPGPSPWAEMTGPVAMLAKGGKCYSHGSFVGRDMTGTIYLILQEVIAPDEPYADIIMKFYTEHLCLNNTLFSQPYYSTHPYVHMHRGEVKPFLKEFYSGFSSLADRETYTFWEHLYHESCHKLHEETWFLMRCRWMLMAEEYEDRKLKLLTMVPRAWLEDGNVIEVNGMKSYFGDVKYRVESRVAEGKILANIVVGSDGYPAANSLTIRLPHPDNRKAVSVSCGHYNPDTETIVLNNFTGRADLELLF